MANIRKIEQIQSEMVAWRHDLHAHPEIAFEETRTADFVARKLTEFGIEVHRGLAKTGVVGTLTNGDGPAIGLRADLDALPINEQTGAARRMPARCMPAAMMGTPPCCWARRNI